MSNSIYECLCTLLKSVSEATKPPAVQIPCNTKGYHGQSIICPSLFVPRGASIILQKIGIAALKTVALAVLRAFGVDSSIIFRSGKISKDKEGNSI